MPVEFQEIDDLKRDREVEGSIGIRLRLAETAYVTVLCQSDANPRMRTHGARKLREIQRLRNAGAPVEQIDTEMAAYLYDCVVTGWEVLDARGQPAAYTRENWIAYCLKHLRVIQIVDRYTEEQTNFRRAQAEAIGDQLKN